MNKIFVHHRSSHHAENSGYGRLIDFVEGKVIYGQIKFPYRLAKFLAKRHSQNLGIYNATSILKSVELFFFLSKHRNKKNIVHFLNGERDIRYLNFFKRIFPNTKFCATFHKPPEILKKNISNPIELKKLDAAIAVGDNQVSFLKEWLDLEKVVYIPHGVDTNFFKPNEAIKEKHTLLFVGQHLRDFDVFNKTVARLVKKKKDLKIKVVIHPAYISKIVSQPNVEIFTSLNDNKLLKLYQEATIFYLPMLDSTACNSLLEAIACGLPIVTNAVGGNVAYLSETENVLIRESHNELYVEEILKLFQDTLHLKKLSNSSRTQALKYSWKQVAKETICFHMKL